MLHIGYSYNIIILDFAGGLLAYSPGPTGCRRVEKSPSTVHHFCLATVNVGLVVVIFQMIYVEWATGGRDREFLTSTRVDRATVCARFERGIHPVVSYCCFLVENDVKFVDWERNLASATSVSNPNAKA